MPIQETKPTFSPEEIRSVPAEAWTVKNGHGRMTDVDYRLVTLTAEIDGREVTLSQSDFDLTPGYGTNPSKIGSSSWNGHHWNSEHSLFREIADKIEADLTEAVEKAIPTLPTLVAESAPEHWDRGPKTDKYRFGEFPFGGYQRNFGHGDEYSQEFKPCVEGYVGRVGDVSILARQTPDMKTGIFTFSGVEDGSRVVEAVMKPGELIVELSMNRGDFYITRRVPQDVAVQVMEALRAKGISGDSKTPLSPKLD